MRYARCKHCQIACEIKCRGLCARCYRSPRISHLYPGSQGGRSKVYTDQVRRQKRQLGPDPEVLSESQQAEKYRRLLIYESQAAATGRLDFAAAQRLP